MPQVGLQLWTVRNDVSQLDPLLDAVARTGVTAIEPFGLGNPRLAVGDRVARARALRRSAQRAGVAIPSVHIALPPPRSVGELLDEMDALGVGTAVAATAGNIAGFGDDAFRSVSSIHRLADRLNTLSQLARAAGLRIGYHNHAAEFAPVGIKQRPAYEELVDRLEPDVVLELDVLWAQSAGQDPADLVAGLGRRVRYLHINDVLNTTRPHPHLPAGQGEVALARTIAASPADLEVLYIEATTPPCGMTELELVAASAAWLRLAIAVLLDQPDASRPLITRGET